MLSSVNTMKLHVLALAFAVLLASHAPARAFCAGAIVKEIQSIARQAEVVDAVKAGNSNPPGKMEILALDERWIRSKGQIPEARQILSSRASQFLSEVMKSKSYFKEAILTGNQGETIAMNQVTTDYWQGDEEKFTEIFDSNLPSRKPDSYISRARWDESVQSMISQVSVPVYDGHIMVGTLTVGIDLKRVPPQNH